MQYQHITEIQWASSNALPVRLQSMGKLDEISNVQRQFFPVKCLVRKEKNSAFIYHPLEAGLSQSIWVKIVQKIYLHSDISQ